MSGAPIARCVSLQQIAEHKSEFTPNSSSNGPTSSQSVQRTPPPNAKSHKNKKEDFEIIRLLGSGAFGTVVLARKRDGDKFFAMKIVQKALLCRVTHAHL